MSRYDLLWEYVRESGKTELTLSFDEIGLIIHAELDHSFLKYRRELSSYGYETAGISLKKRTISFRKTEAEA